MFCANHHKVFASLVLCLSLVTTAYYAHAEEAPIMGAGAHFSWVVFDELKPELERQLGRKLKLFGRESMLGAGCNAGVKSAQQNKPGNETFGFVCCPLSDKEIADNHLKVYPLALEPILILVNRDNGIDNLSAEQARDIFRGKIINWKDVGGDDSPIIVVTRLHCKSRPGHWKTILKDAREFTSKRLNVQSAADMVSRMKDFRTAIGHTGSAWKFSSGDNLKSVKINGYAPTANNIKNGNYPFYRNLSAITSDTASGDVSRLMALTQSLLINSNAVSEYSLLPFSPDTRYLFNVPADL